MPLILLEIAPLAGSLLDGATFRPPSFFAFTQLSPNHYQAVAPAPGAVGVIDPREFLEQLENQFRNVIDKDGTEAQNPSRVTDLILERAIIAATANLTTAATIIGVHTPPLPISATGVRDQTTPNGAIAEGNAQVKKFGGTGFVSNDIAGVRGGYVVIPTNYRLFAASDGTNPRLLLWLLPIYNCCCMSNFLDFAEGGAPP